MKKSFKLVIISITSFLLLLGITLVAFSGVSLHNEATYANLTIDLFMIIVVLCLLVSLLSEKVIHDSTVPFFTVLLVTVIWYLISSVISWAYNGNSKFPFITQCADLFLYVSGYILLLMYTNYLLKCVNKKTLFIDVIKNITILLFCIFTLLLVLNIFFGFFYSYENNIYIRGDMYWISHMYPLIVIIIDGILIIQQKSMSKNVKFSLLSYCLLPLFGITLQIFFYGISVMELSITLAIIIIYINMHLQRGKTLAEQRTKLLVSQINPHFVYNTLTTIAALCDVDSLLAKETTLNFSTYLRRNLNSLSTDAPIPLEKELEHVECYLKIEQTRFGDRVDYEFNIESKDFSIPSLTIQPLVENSVKNGICKKAEGGKIIITTKENKDCYFITIEDNGVGFDVNAKINDDKTHVGVSSVRDRLKDMCKGELHIDSKIDVGTTATIIIPKKER